MAPQVQPRLIVLGIALALVGILALGLTARDRTEDAGASEPIGHGIPAEQTGPNRLTMLWPVVGGLSLALGAAFIGVGMNRWKR